MFDTPGPLNKIFTAAYDGQAIHSPLDNRNVEKGDIAYHMNVI